MRTRLSACPCSVARTVSEVKRCSRSFVWELVWTHEEPGPRGSAVQIKIEKPSLADRRRSAT